MRRSDKDEFRQFARGHAVPLRRSAYLLCGDWHLADDLVQARLIKLHGEWPRVLRGHQPVSYARKILLRNWLDERRRPWRRAERRDGTLPEAVDWAAGPVARHEQAGPAGGAPRVAGDLPPRQRAVLVLRYFESLSVSETAAALGAGPPNG